MSEHKNKNTVHITKITKHLSSPDNLSGFYFFFFFTNSLTPFLLLSRLKLRYQSELSALPDSIDPPEKNHTFFKLFPNHLSPNHITNISIPFYPS